jgi:hypothetical protein
VAPLRSFRHTNRPTDLRPKNFSKIWEGPSPETRGTKRWVLPFCLNEPSVAAIMQDRNGQASDEGTGAIVAGTGVVAKRRVSFAVAAPIILLCGGIGVAAGWLFPPQALMTGWERADNPAKAGTAQSARLGNTSAAPPKADVVVEPPPPTSQSTDLPAPPTKPATTSTTGPATPEQPQSAPAVAPAPERRSSIGADAPGGIAHEAQASGAASKMRPRTAEKRERRAAREAAKPKRAPIPEPKQERATQKRSPTIISQIPVLGPVFGLLLP